MKVLKTLSRIYLDAGKLDGEIMFYERLFSEKCRLRFTHPKLGLELAQVGSVLLIAGPMDNLETVKLTQMTFLVDSIHDFRDTLVSEGATILEGPNEVPTGLNMRVQHPDGAIVEYVEHRQNNEF
ncbi:VOC family protein [Alicyclobacillus kakegawensis]|uniref:VOC family protein n=1 Tax=Alicyclobacillus kakegawensis TaxID=392012 RepID=UPI000833D5C3|nr:glyoxalase/bleomycin resistance/dioxygenase family protein [Alicyclobacillus kakegawensis]